MSLAELKQQSLRNLRRDTHSVVDLHHEHLRQTLVMVSTRNGKFTTTVGRYLTGWSERSLLRHLQTLRSLDLVDKHDDRGRPYHWSITQAGRDELTG